MLTAPLLALTAAFAAVAHPNSISSSRVRVPLQRDRVLVEIVCEAPTLCESVPLDRDGDKRLDPAELEAGWDAVRSYVLERYTIHWCDDAQVAPQPLSGSLTALAESPSASRPSGGGGAGGPGGAGDAQWIRIDLEYPSARAVEGLRIEFRLFFETNAAHVDFSEIEWEGEGARPWKFDAENSAWTFYDERLSVALDVRERPHVLWDAVKLGVEHILTGWDHIGFVLALLVASRGVRGLLGTITAFTLAHSLTLALAALDVLHVPGRWVEPAIALSIAYVAALNLWWKRPRAPWSEALGFGLIHGLGFAGVLAETLLAEPQKLRVLVGFNLGVELGQVGVVLASLGACALLRRARRHSAPADASANPTSLVPAPFDRWLSYAVLACGAYWFIERILPA
jgi:hydrogenase/urease accessory protein HupE